MHQIFLASPETNTVKISQSIYNSHADPTGSGERTYYQQSSTLTRRATGRRLHLDDVEVVFVTERLQDGGHSALRDVEALPSHAAARVQQNDDVLGRAGCLNVPGTNRDIDVRGKNITFVYLVQTGTLMYMVKT